MGKKHKITGPGRVVDRSAKNGKVVITFDPSPGEMVTEARKDKGRLVVTVRPADGEPIQISASPKAWQLKLEDAAIPKERLADFEGLITEEEDVQVSIEYTPDEKLPGMDGEDPNES